MLLESLPINLLKLLSVNGFSQGLPKLSQFLKPGAYFNATVLEYFPQKHKAIIKVDDKTIVVATRQSLTPGYSFSVHLDQLALRSPLSMKIISPENLLPSEFEDKAHISKKYNAIIDTLATTYGAVVVDSAVGLKDVVEDNAISL